MVSVFSVEVFNNEIVDAKAKGDAPRVVALKANSVWNWGVAVFVEVTYKVIVSKHCCLLQSVHAFFYFYEYGVCWSFEGVEIIFSYDILGNGGKWDPHVFWFRHWRSEIKIFQITCHEPGAFGGVTDDAINKYFCFQ